MFVNLVLKGEMVFGEMVYGILIEIFEKIDIVDVFWWSEFLLEVVVEILKIEVFVFWV